MNDREWIGHLAGLFTVLAAEAARKPPKPAEIALDSGWTWRTLQDGVVVAMRAVGVENRCWRLELRIAAEPTFAGWDDRLAELIRELSIQVSQGDRICPFPGALWYRLEPQTRDDGKLAARFVSLMTAEITPPERWRVA